MLRPLSRQEVRHLDQHAIKEYGMSGLQLMENAGRGATDLLLQQLPVGLILIVAGKGNNAGDGFVMARHLENAGCAVKVVLLADESALTGDAAINFKIIQKSGIPIEKYHDGVSETHFINIFNDAEWIVDAMLGTGMTGSLREPYRTVIQQINNGTAKVFAVDLPSGMNCDSGEPQSQCIHAELTATLVAKKKGFESSVATEFLGEVHVVDIGLPQALLRTYL